MLLEGVYSGSIPLELILPVRRAAKIDPLVTLLYEKAKGLHG